MAVSFTVTGEDISYYPSDVPIPTSGGGAFTANQGPYFNWYRGAGTKPPKGRPCLIRVATTRFDTTLSTDPTGAANQDSSFAAEMLLRGCTYITASVTLPDSSAPYTQYVSDGAVTHAGLVHIPGVTPAGLGAEPYTSVNYTFSYKDAIFLIQHIKNNAVTYEVDPDRIFVQGTTAMAQALMWTIYKERALELGAVATDAQYGMSTRVAAAFLDMTRVSWLTQLGTNTGSAVSFPDAANPGTDWNTPAVDNDDISTAYKTAVSLLGTGGYGDADVIRKTPVYISTGIASSAAQSAAVNTIIDPPFTGATATEPLHSVWNSSVLRKFVTMAPVRFACGGTVAAALDTTVANEDFTYNSDDASTQRAALVADQVAWAEQYLLSGKVVAAVRG